MKAVQRAGSSAVCWAVKWVFWWAVLTAEQLAVSRVGRSVAKTAVHLVGPMVGAKAVLWAASKAVLTAVLTEHWKAVNWAVLSAEEMGSRSAGPWAVEWAAYWAEPWD